MTDSTPRENAAIATAYLVTLGAMVYASVSPALPLWAFSSASFLDTGWIFIAIAGLLWLPIAWWLGGRLARSNDAAPWAWPALAGIGIAAAGLMVLFRTQAHFLGDGYEMLSTFATQHPILKTRALGEATLHLWVRELLGGAIRDASIMSFRVLSVGAGVLYLGVLVYGARKLFANARQRLLFVLAMTTPGYLLLYFGYVELYSVFVAAVGLFAVVGMLVAKGAIGRWWILAALAPNLVLHVMGVVMVPAAIYLLFAGTSVARRVQTVPLLTRAATGLVAFAAGAALFFYLQGQSYFFRLAMLPVVADRFTLDGYTLFSGRHLIDIGNLLLLLAPGAAVIAVVAFTAVKRHSVDKRIMTFLVVLALSQWGAVFLFDPKLGMPRDWDLFAFAGVSIAAAGTCWLVQRAGESRGVTVALLLVAGLNLLALGGRVAVQSTPEAAAEQYRTHMQWDLKRHQTSWTILVTYYQDIGDSTRAQAEFAHWMNVFPGYQRNREGLALLNSGKFAEALQIFRDVVRENPSFTPAYGNLGTAFFRLNQLDSAETYLQIARGMNPYNPVVLAAQGQLLWSRNDADGAVAAWRQALAVDSTQTQAALGLANYYRQQRDRDNYFRYIAIAADGGGAPASVLVELGEYFLSVGQATRGEVYLRQAVTAGLDSTAAAELRRRHPGLAL